MRLSSRAPALGIRAFALALTFAPVALGHSQSRSSPPPVGIDSGAGNRPSAGRRASDLLALARRAVGRPDLVKSLAFDYRRTWDSKPESHQDSSFAIVIPDGYRTRFGEVIHALDGKSFYQNKGGSEAIQKIAETNMRSELLRWKAFFLLPLPPDVTMEYLGQVEADTIREERIVFRQGADSTVTLGLDSTSYLPTRVLFPGPCGMTDLKVDERATVKGVLFPTKLRFVCSQYRATVELLKLTVDDPSTARGLFAGVQGR